MPNGGPRSDSEEELIQCYFAAFNRHDLEAVMACFHSHPVIVHATGVRFEGDDEVRRHYETISCGSGSRITPLSEVLARVIAGL
jgi:ketosteroid isomerase-like protein